MYIYDLTLFSELTYIIIFLFFMTVLHVSLYHFVKWPVRDEVL